MTKQEFDRLSEKYNAGKCTEEEITLLEQWADLHFKKHSEQTVFDREDEMLATEERIWKKVENTSGLSAPKRIPRKIKPVWIGFAASVLLMAAAGALLIKREAWELPKPSVAGFITGIETKNTTISRQRIVLPDSSIVTLEAGAMILTDENYGKNMRVIRLNGEAFFEVKPNPQLPFLVHTGELVTEVLGTSFRIRPEEYKNTIEVSVVTGKVSVYTGRAGRDKKRTGVIAIPNQKVVYDTQLKTITQDLVDTPEMVAPPPLKSAFQFDDTPVEKVLALMRQVYGVEIVVGSSFLNRCVFTGDLHGLELYEQLDHLCEVINARYETRGTTIFITGEGCKGPS